MRILHIAHYNYSAKNRSIIFKENINNGIERFLFTILKYHTDTEHFVLLRDIFRFDQIHILGYKNNELFFYNTYFGVDIINSSGLEKINKILHEIDCDLIHFHYLVEGTKDLCNQIQSKSDIEFIATIHDESFLNADDNTKKTEIFFQQLNCVIFPHKRIYEKFVKNYPEIKNKSLIIPNGVDSHKYKLSPRKTQGLKIGILGRINKEKGAFILDELMSLNKNKKISFVVIGKVLVDTNNPIKEINYDISKDNLQEIVQSEKIDIICIPSIVHESFSYTAMEATAIGMPVLAYNIGAFVELENENRGFLVRELNANMMMERIYDIYNLKTQNKKKWYEIYELLSQYNIFTEKEMVDEYRKIYDSNSRKVKTNKKIDNLKNIKEIYYGVHDNKFENHELRKQREEYLNVNKQLAEQIKQVKEEHKKYKSTIKEQQEQTSYTISNLEKVIERSQKQICEYERIIKYKEKHWFRNAIGSFIRNIKRIASRSKLDKYSSPHEYNEWFLEQRANLSWIYLKYLDFTLKIKPKISILIPVYNPPHNLLRICLDSISEQYYKNFEVCVVDDCSTDTKIKDILEEYASKDKRFRIHYSDKNGHISEATNVALCMAKGEYITLVDNDDFIEKDALLEFVKLVNRHPNVDMAYSDEDKITEDGRVFLHPFFKPDWSPETFFSHMYTCHLGFYKTKIATDIGGFRSKYNGAQDYDFVLRFTEKTNNIYHIRKILYHWRITKNSTASGPQAKNYAYEASVKAKEDALYRRNIEARVVQLKRFSATYNYYYPSKEDYVSIIIPIKDQVNYLKRLLDSIYSKSSWKNFEVIIVNNESKEKQTLDYLEYIKKKYDNIRILDLFIPFNYSKINNLSVKEAKGNILLFLNNDIKVITSDWLERLIGQAKQKGVGAVGARLYYPDNTVQHSGVAIIGVGPVHVYCGSTPDTLKDFGRMQLNYNYLAVTGAVLMIEKEKFEQCGGFDENLKVAYNDVELCIRLYHHGFLSVCRSDVELYHYESISRGRDHDCKQKMLRLQKERNYLYKKWDKYVKTDPFYNELSKLQC